MKSEQELSWIAERLREPSTYAGLGILLSIFAHTSDPGLVKSLSMIGMGIGGLIAFFMADRK